MQVSSQAWNLLALLPNLQRLDAAFTNAKNDTVRTLSPLRTLTSLNLDSTFVTDQGMRFISSFSALQYLNLSDTKYATCLGRSVPAVNDSRTAKQCRP